ncbi:MAG: penicillin-binding transpeptidase domain-containing protein [Oscillospiraceae bacterium]|nr:penicillin-binding transpeptidase domain-containing protein [Oscillospiraceae bacterium]
MKSNSNKKKTAQKPSRAMLVRTVFLLAICGVAAFIILASRLYEIQISSNGKYEAQALEAQLRQETVTASRGTIYDANGKILAMSAAVENVFISPFEINRDSRDVNLIADGLSTILDVPYASILEKAAKIESQYQIIKMKVESDEAGQVREFIKEHGLSGIYLEPNSKRYYPNNNLASQILGFVGTENRGLDGLEQRYNDYLTGVDGRAVSLRNAKGTDLLFTEFNDYYEARDGFDITLTIDSSIQYFVEKHLEKAIVDYDVLNGAICIAMNPKTGAILAMANYPNFDPNDYQKLSEASAEKLSVIEDEEKYTEALHKAQYQQWRNRSLADTYEPGSVFKIITLSMALEEGIATSNSSFVCTGSKDILGREEDQPVRCWRRWGHGPQTLVEAMQNSCNIACVEMGLKLGAQTFYKYIDAFGLREKTGLDNSAEGWSQWWADSVFFAKYNKSQLASASFGQTFTVTPIQMITAAAAAINGGYLMKPYYVKQVADSNGNIIEATEPTVRRQVISSETSATVRGILESVVKNGTATNAQIRGYSVGGKTGTSENVVQIALSGDNAPKDYIVSFLGFAPADNPEIVILLLLDTPSRSTGIYISGGSMAAPVVGNMLADILPLCLNIMPKYTEDDIKDINVNMPRITNISVEEAKDLLWNMGLAYTVVGEGDSVTGQLPAPNACIASGLAAILYADEEVPRETVTVPLITGLKYVSAKQALENKGLFIRTTGAPKSDSKVVVSVQSIPPGQEVAYGSVIEVTLIDNDSIELRG